MIAPLQKHFYEITVERTDRENTLVRRCGPQLIARPAIPASASTLYSTLQLVRDGATISAGAVRLSWGTPDIPYFEGLNEIFDSCAPVRDRLVLRAACLRPGDMIRLHTLARYDGAGCFGPPVRENEMNRQQGRITRPMLRPVPAAG